MCSKTLKYMTWMMNSYLQYQKNQSNRRKLLEMCMEKKNSYSNQDLIPFRRKYKKEWMHKSGLQWLMSNLNFNSLSKLKRNQLLYTDEISTKELLEQVAIKLCLEKLWQALSTNKLHHKLLIEIKTRPTFENQTLLKFDQQALKDVKSYLNKYEAHQSHFAFLNVKVTVKFP